MVKTWAMVAICLPNVFFANAIFAESKAQGVAAKSFLSQLDKKQFTMAARSWLSPERTEWTYFHWGHTGLALSDLTPSQREASLNLLATGLSESGNRKALQVLELEADQARKTFLGRLWEDPDAYHTAIFGVPDPANLWSWRFEGHHLSVNLSLANGNVTSGTPYFIGAEPAHVSTGPLEGMHILKREESQARALFLSLNELQRLDALIKDEAPGDIVTGNQSTALLPCCEGIALTALDTGQQAELLTLIDLIVGQLHVTAAAKHLARMQAAGVENLTFAWAGSAIEGEPHYYRIQGPTLLIEYDNTEDGANHAHLVLRDPAMDFGGNPLSAHYTASAHLYRPLISYCNIRAILAHICRS